jgi:NADH-quinone oxidoreductase subunit M
MLTLILILLPLVLALITLSLKGEKAIRQFALAGSLIEAGVMVAAFIQFKTSCHCNLVFDPGWLQPMGISLKFGLDGISLLLVMLTTLLVPVIIVSTFSHTYSRPSAFYALVLFMEMALVGVFSASDGLIFYIFWELALIPAWFICAVWGGNDRIRITFKFFIYTFAGSLFMLVALVWVYLRTPLPHSFDFMALYNANLQPGEQAWVFAALFLAFAIKMPVFPFHTWQPDTYTESPAAGSMLLAGIMLKMGIYGVIRLLIPLCPDAVVQFGPVVIILAVTGIVYASLIAIRQDDLKRLVAYSSIAHVGLIAAGLFTLTATALNGAVIQMVSHGINIVGLFFLIDFIQVQTGTRKISDLGGIAQKAPRLAALFMIIMLGSIALPLTNGFIGEFMLLLGLYQYQWPFALVAGLTIIFGAVYMLWMYQRVMFGETSPAAAPIRDLNTGELVTLAPIVLMILWIGVYPALFIDTIWPEVVRILTLAGI